MIKYKLPINYNKLNAYERKQVRNQYIELQNNICIFCKHSLSEPPPEHILNKHINWSLFPDNFQKYPIHLQHDHNTNMTEGAVHMYCNAVLWQYYNK
jgi:hypothetical protein